MTREDLSELIVAKTIHQRMGVAEEPGVSLLTSQLSEMLIRVDFVTAITGLSVPTIYRQMAIGTFPRPFRITPTRQGAKAWRLSEIMTWINGRERAEDDTA